MITVFLSLYRKDMWDYYSRTGKIKNKKIKRGKNEKTQLWIQRKTLNPNPNAHAIELITRVSIIFG